MTTDQETGFVHTFSHQPPAPPAAESAARPAVAKPEPYAPLSAVLAAATTAMAPSLVEAPEDAVAGRLRKLRHVREQMPANTSGALAELRGRAPAKLLQIVDGWAWDGPNLLVLGPTRVGKTSGVAVLVRLLLENAARSDEGFSPAIRRLWGGCAGPVSRADLIRWQSCRDLTTSVKEYPLGQGAPETIRSCQYARLLVLDDVGATDDKATLERILNARYERRWPTITTSGLTSRELVATLGEALVRRMTDRAGANGLIVNLFPKVTAKAP